MRKGIILMVCAITLMGCATDTAGSKKDDEKVYVSESDIMMKNNLAISDEIALAESTPADEALNELTEGKALEIAMEYLKGKIAEAEYNRIFEGGKLNIEVIQINRAGNDYWHFTFVPANSYGGYIVGINRENGYIGIFDQLK